MCGRYKLEEHWQEHSRLTGFDLNDPPWPTENPLKVSSVKIRPTDRMPIVRFNEDGRLIAELRRWGFIPMVNGKAIDKAKGRPKTKSCSKLLPCVLPRTALHFGSGVRALRPMSCQPPV